MAQLAKRLDAHFIVCAAAGAAVVGAVAQKSRADVVYSGVQNIVVNNDFFGVYVDLVTHATSNASFSSFDTNPFYAGNEIFAGSNGTMCDTTTFDVLNLAPGTPIGPDLSSFFTGVTSANTNFVPGQAGIYGVAFFNESQGNAINFGWVRIIMGTPPYPGGGNGTIVDWAYEDSGNPIPAGAVPAPGSLALLALGAVGLTGRRRK